MVGPGKMMGTWGDLGRREGVALHGHTEVAALEIFQDVWDCSKLSYSSEIIAFQETHLLFSVIVLPNMQSSLQSHIFLPCSLN